MKLEELVLKRFDFAVRNYASLPAIANLEIKSLETILDNTIGLMRIEMHARIYGKEGQRIEVKWPATWWQHVKERFFPKWALRRWPVTYSARVIEAAALAPALPVAVEDRYSFVAAFTRDDLVRP